MQKRALIFLFVFVLNASLLINLMPSQTVSALSGSEFQAGRIIDDNVFFNPGFMTVNDIQNFLNSKVPSCDTNGTQPYGGTTRAEYSISRGYPPPFVCLRDFRQDTVAKNAETGLCNGYGVENQSAAQIIHGVANSCGVNPKALIVLLQKEQSLITDDWPWPIQYRSATGYGCPDTAPCDAQYYGFFNQVYLAARQFKRYARDSHLFNYRAGRSNYIQYNPNASCGGSDVFIHNNATAGLYNYTPYQPNASALANLYGIGDGCGAYGNRNFWRMYNDWFGSTYANDYAAQPVWQSVFTDSTKTTSLGWGATLLPGRQAYAVVVMKNMGNATWTRGGGANDVRLATHNPWGRQSNFCHASWIPTAPACTRATGLVEASVAPGQNGTFEFPITAPPTPGFYNEGFGLIVDGKSTFSTGFVTIPLTIVPEVNAAQPVWQSVFTDSTKTTSLGWGATLLPGRQAYAVVVMKNTGNIAWTQSGGGNDVMLGTVNGQDRNSLFCTAGWLHPCKRAVRLTEASVAPGQNGTFEFPITAPSQVGTYNESFGLVVNGKGYFAGGSMTFPITVETERNAAQPVWQSVFTDSTKTTSLGWGATLPQNQSAWAVVQVKNVGNIAWTRTGGANDTMIGTVLNQDRQSNFCTVQWLHPCSRPVRLSEASVAPGQNGTFEFPITAPSQVGTYNESFGLVVNGKGYFTSGFFNFRIIVQ